MTNPVSNAAPAATPAQPVVTEFNGHKVVDGKVQPNYVALNFIRGESKSTLSSLQTEYDAKVKADADAQKIADDKKAREKENEKTPTWKLVLGFIPYYLPKFILGTIARLFSNCCALFGYGKAEVKTEVKVDPKGTTTSTATVTAK